MTPRAAWGLVKDTFRHWSADKTPRLGAALAYYAVFSIAPLVIIAIDIAGLLFGEEQARKHLVAQINSATGGQVGGAIAETLKYVHESHSGGLATVVSTVVLLFGASGLFAQLQDALNTIWGVQAKSGRGVLGVIKDRLGSYLLILVLGLLLVASLVSSSVLAALTKLWPADALPGGAYLWLAVNWLASFAIITVLFAAVYRLLPDVKLGWGDVGVGAAVTALLFVAGNQLISLYLGKSSWINAYGAAGSLVVVLLWVYYSSQVFLLGAEFTQVWFRRSGKRVAPAENAEAVTEEARAQQGMAPETPSG